MLYCIADAKYPIKFVSCGNLISEDNFVHPQRNIDTFVVILVLVGTLHISQGEGRDKYDVGPNEYFLLVSDTLHYGYKPSSGYLSYYWAHFYITDPNYSIYNQGALLRNSQIAEIDPFSISKESEIFMIPVHGSCSMANRCPIFFNQLLDLYKRDNYMSTWRCHYALSLLLLEVTYEALPKESRIQIPDKLLVILEWIQTHYDQPLMVNEIAAKYNYHPTYLTKLFKMYTGYPMLAYINRMRISIAKNLLSTQQEIAVAEVADLCGFGDEKYFMKLFKRYEKMTPSQYRKTFQQKKVNSTASERK